MCELVSQVNIWGSAIVYLPSEQQDAENTRDYVQKRTNGQRKVHLIATDGM